MCLHMLLGPLLAYNGLDNFQGFKERMQIPEAEYFSYVIPAVICFILGLHFNSKNLQGEFIDQRSIHEYVTDKRDIAYSIGKQIQ